MKFLERNTVRLTPENKEKFSAIGRHRHSEALIAGKKDIYGGEFPEVWHIQGALAEGSFKLLIGVTDPILKVNDYDGPDHGLRSEVRATDYLGGCLIIRPRDMTKNKTLRNWYLMVCLDNFQCVWSCAGWISGEENILRPEYIKRNKDGNGAAWFVPQMALTEFDLTKHIPS